MTGQQDMQANSDPRWDTLSRAASEHVVQGWSVETENRDQYFMVLRWTPRSKVNHLLHFFITILTCLLWGIVWIILTLNADKEKRMRLSVDENLVVSTQVTTVG